MVGEASASVGVCSDSLRDEEGVRGGVRGSGGRRGEWLTLL